MWSATYRAARRLVILVIGGTVVLLGVVMVVTPGPALLVIPAGLAILATEFVWARALLKRMRDSVREHMPGSAGRAARAAHSARQAEAANPAVDEGDERRPADDSDEGQR